MKQNIILLIFFSLILSSCWKKIHKVKTLELISATAITLDNSFETPLVPQNDTINGQAIEINLLLNYVEVETGDDDIKGILWEVESPIDSVSITSNNDFGDNYPTGTNLKDLFYVFIKDGFPASYKYATLEDYFYGDRKLEISGISSAGYRVEHARLLLMTAPQSEKEHIFTIRLFSFQGDTTETQTQPVFLAL